MQTNYSLSLANEDEMVTFGGQLAQVLSSFGVVYLYGDLGAGKTTFCRGVLRAFGHQGAVKSPTYTLVEPYEVGPHKVYHFDLYRLCDPEELEFIGGRDYFSDQALCLIEWPSKGLGEIPAADLEITFDYDLPGRIASVVAKSDHGRLALQTIINVREAQ